MGNALPSLVLTLSLTLGACDSEPKPVATNLPPLGDRLQLSFDWPLPARAIVKRHSTMTYTGPGARPERDIVSKFVLALSQAAGEAHLLLEQREMEFVTVNGYDATLPEVQRVVAPMAAQMVAGLPLLRIQPNGDFLGITDWDAHMEKLEPMLRQMGDNALMEPAVVETTLRMMRQPAFRALAIQKSADPWNAWVGAWVGMELERGQALEFEHMQAVGMTELPQTVVYTYEGEDAEYPGHARLRMTVSMSGREVAALVEGLMLQVTAAMQEAKPGVDLADPESVDLRMQSTIVLVTRPDKLLPRLVTMEKRITGRVAGHDMERVDSERWEFDWQN